MKTLFLKFLKPAAEAVMIKFLSGSILENLFILVLRLFVTRITHKNTDFRLLKEDENVGAYKD